MLVPPIKNTQAAPAFSPEARKRQLFGPVSLGTTLGSPREKKNRLLTLTDRAHNRRLSQKTEDLRSKTA